MTHVRSGPLAPAAAPKIEAQAPSAVMKDAPSPSPLAPMHFPAGAARMGLMAGPELRRRPASEPELDALLDLIGPQKIWRRMAAALTGVSLLSAEETGALRAAMMAMPAETRRATIAYFARMPDDSARRRYALALVAARPRPAPRDEFTTRLLALLGRPLSPSARQAANAGLAEIDRAYGGAPVTREAVHRVRAAAEGASKTLASGYGSSDLQVAARRNIGALHEKMDAWIAERRPLSVEMICEINRTLNDGLDMGFGRGKVGGVLRGHLPGVPVDQQDIAAGPDWSYRYALARAVPQMTHDFVAHFARVPRGVHPIEHAARAYQHLVSIHPFFDANGRTSRAVMDYILMSHGYLPALIVGERVKAGVFSLRQDNTPPDFVIQGVIEGQRNALELGRTVRHG